jgi:flagellar hook protein FlgE
MMRAMSSAIAGLKAMQTGIDVIGNNISNVNTNGFKASRTTYSDVYYQTISGATAGDFDKANNTAVTKGGTNNYQLGYGATAASVDVYTGRNGYDTTSSATDCYIDGEGYFAVMDGGSATAPTYAYTRVGDFHFDSNGELVNSRGSLVCGSNNSALDPKDPAAVTYSPAPSTDADTLNEITTPVPIVVKEFSSYKNVKIGSDGVITGERDGNVLTLGRIAIANIPNPAGLTQAGGSMYKTSSSSGTATFYTAGAGPTGKLVTSALETSNVDLSTELANMIVTQRGFQANSKIISVTDSMLEEIVNMKR